MLVANAHLVAQCLYRHMDTEHALPFDCLVHALWVSVLQRGHLAANQTTTNHNNGQKTKYVKAPNVVTKFLKSKNT